MPFIYVLRSQTTGRHYTGATTNLQVRLALHNSDLSFSTKNRGPWDLVHHEEFTTLAEALRRERFLKSGKGRDELHRILTAKCDMLEERARSSAG
jgi:putative endonuclease